LIKPWISVRAGVELCDQDVTEFRRGHRLLARDQLTIDDHRGRGAFALSRSRLCDENTATYSY
jgi:hypothetical protein